MQVRFNHYHGTQEQFDLCCYRAELDCEPDEQAAALAMGWLLHDGRWYQSRSTRLACDAHDWPAETTAYSFDIETGYSSELKAIWIDYLKRKGFAEQYDPGYVDPDCFWLVARDCQHNAVGFTKMRAYRGGLESQYNAYVQQATNLGRIMIDHEVALAKKQGLGYLYIGSGYEQSSAYKAHLPGFEWWTGNEWSRDRKHYLNLCYRDSKINNLVQLAHAYENG